MVVGVCMHLFVALFLRNILLCAYAKERRIEEMYHSLEIEIRFVMILTSCGNSFHSLGLSLKTTLHGQAFFSLKTFFLLREQ